MLLRRGLLVSSGGAIGDFTQYETKTAVGVGNSNTFVQVPTSFTPKLVIITGGADENGHIISLVLDFVNTIGAVLFRNSSNQLLSTSGVRPQYTDSEPTVSAAQYYYYNGALYLSRANSNGYFADTDTFTFEIYG